jgi:hypothetical protein
MTQPTARRELSKDSKNPNFLLIVLMSAAALILIFLCAYFLVGDKGRKLLPGLHHDPQPTSYLGQPAPNAIQS